MLNAPPPGLSCRIIARLREDGVGSKPQIEGDTIKAGGAEATFAGGIFQGKDATDQIMSQEINEVIGQLVDGYSVSLFVLGPSNGGATELFFGQKKEGLMSVLGHEDGLATKCLKSLEKELNKVSLDDDGESGFDSKYSSSGVGHPGSYTLGIQFLEIYEDDVHDLINPSNVQTLKIEYGEHGAHVPNLTKFSVSGGASGGDGPSPGTFENLIGRCREATTQAVSAGGPLADKSTQILIVNILQTLGNEVLYSQLRLVHLPATEKLNDNIDSLTLTEGASNKELVATANLIASLSDPMKAQFTSFDESKTTQLCEEALAGNSMTIAIVSMNNSMIDPATLFLAQQLSQLGTYPIKTNQLGHGSLRRYRLVIGQLRHEIFALKNGGPDESTAIELEGLESKLLDLKESLLEKEAELHKQSTAGKMLTNQYNELRDQYATLVESKTLLQAQLIKSEEERLRVSKILVDMQIESTDMQDKLGEKTYNLETKLLTVENSAVEQQVQLEKLRLENVDLKDKLKASQDAKKEMSLEYIALKENYTELINEADGDKDEQQRISVELLNLANENRVLEKKHLQLEMDRDALRKSNRESKEEIKRLQTELSQHERDSRNQLRRYERQMEEARRNYEKKLNETKDRARHKLRQASEEIEGMRLDMMKKDVEITKHKSSFQSNLEHAKADQRALLQAAKAADSGGKIEMLKSQYERIIATMERTEEANQQKIRSLEQQLRDNENKIVHLSNTSSSLDANAAGLRQSNLDLQQQVQRLHKQIRDKESEVQRLSAGGGATQEEKEKLLRENADLERKVNNLSADLNREKQLSQQHQSASGNLQQTMMTAQAQVQVLKEQLASLKEQNMEDKQEMRELRMQAMKARTQQPSAASAVDSAHKDAEIKQLRALLEQRLAQQYQPALSQQHGQETTNNNRRDREQMYDLRDKVETLTMENKSLRKKLKLIKYQNGDNGGWEEVVDKMQAQHAEKEKGMKDQIKNLEGQIAGLKRDHGLKRLAVDEMKDFQLLTQQRMEKERINLKVRATQAEEELQAFQDYMKASLLSYQKEIIRLSKELAYWKALHSETGHRNLRGGPVAASGAVPIAAKAGRGGVMGTNNVPNNRSSSSSTMGQAQQGMRTSQSSVPLTRSTSSHLQGAGLHHSSSQPSLPNHAHNNNGSNTSIIKNNHNNWSSMQRSPTGRNNGTQQYY